MTKSEREFISSLLKASNTKLDDEAAELGLWQVWAYRCNRCNYVWFPRDYDFKYLEDVEEIFKKKPPKSCARCKSKYWIQIPQRETKNCDKMLSIARLRALQRQRKNLF